MRRNCQIHGAFAVLAALAVAHAAWAATYVVDGQHPQAADENPGAAERPFRTIAKAAKLVQPGDTVLIKPGVYREAVVRFNLRGSPERVTVFRAATEGAVAVSGADAVTEWGAAGGRVWAAPWPHRFGEAAIPRGWPEHTWKFPMNRKEAVFVDGCPLRPVATREAMAPGSFFVDEPNGKLLVWLLDGGSPKEHEVEASVRGPLWRFQGCSHVRVEGLTFRHAAGTATDTAVSLLDSDAMDVVNCRVEWNSGGGIGYWRGARHRLENNVVVFNGGLGIGGRFHQTILRGNETSYNNWRGALAGVFGWHFAGVKLGGATATQIERHVAVNNLARGLWLDFNVTGNVIDGAIVHGNLDRGVYLEAGTGANWLMNSLISGTRGLGHGVTVANSPDQCLYHNTFVANGSWGLWAGGSNEPRGTQPNNSLATDLDVRCNLFHNAGAEGAIELQQRSYGGQEDYVIRSFRADGNRYHDGRREDVFQVAGKRLKLAEWRERGWDKAGVWAAVPLVAPDQLDFRPRDEKSAVVALLPRLDEAALDLLRTPRIQVVAGAFSPPQPDRADAPLPIWADVRRYAPVDEMPLLVGDEAHLPRLWQASQVRHCARDVLLASSAKAWGSDAWLKTGREGDRSIAVLLNPAPWPVDVTLETPAGSLADRVSGQRWDTAAGRLNLPLRPYQALVLEVAGAGPVRATASAPAWVGESLRKQIQSLQAKSAGNAEAAKALAAAQEALNDGRPVAAWEALQARGLRAESAELNRLLSEGRL